MPRSLRQVLLPLLLAASAAAQDAPEAAHRAEVERFRRAREASLKAEDGWLSVAGLHWLKPGETSVGGGTGSDVLLPEGAPDRVGTLTLEGDRARFRPEPGAGVTLGGRPFVEGPIRSDADGAKPDVLAVGRTKLILIKRGARYALRVKDNGAPLREQFAGLRWFPVNPSWRFEAKFTPHPIPTRITFDTIVGEQDVMESPGYVTFDRDGQAYRLDAASEPDGKLWFVFRDATSGRTTPANARQLTTDGPLAGVVVLDFNKAVNLPCAYTPHATCPIAPPRNRLPLAVTAGEQSYRPRGD